MWVGLAGDVLNFPPIINLVSAYGQFNGLMTGIYMKENQNENNKNFIVSYHLISSDVQWSKYILGIGMWLSSLVVYTFRHDLNSSSIHKRCLLKLDLFL